MENGYYYKTTRIKEDVTPIDNVTKFAYYDEDYETVELWHEFTAEELEDIKRQQAEQQAAAEREASLAATIAEQDEAICALYELVASKGVNS